jgi:hypothetical protein
MDLGMVGPTIVPGVLNLSAAMSDGADSLHLSQKRGKQTAVHPALRCRVRSPIVAIQRAYLRP